jgi:cytochrome c oxidase cbb3-type subunit 3
VRSALIFLMATLSVLADGAAADSDSREVVSAELEKPVIRGAIVFKNYCVLCHGERGDGLARSAKLYGVVNLAIKKLDDEHLQKIIRKGGVGVGRSAFMPMWEEELSEEQINDVVAYLKVIGDDASRGEVVFKTNCILCHGISGNGKGRAAHLFDPPPADLTRSNKNNDYKRMIITNGGESMGRSPAMPAWGEQLSPQEIGDAVNYLQTLLVGR